VKPDGKTIVFESPALISPPPESEPTGSARGSKRTHPPTQLWTISVPESLRARLCVSGAPCR
jgi:hypothetical protein